MSLSSDMRNKLGLLIFSGTRLICPVVNIFKEPVHLKIAARQKYTDPDLFYGEICSHDFLNALRATLTSNGISRKCGRDPLGRSNRNLEFLDSTVLISI